MAIPSERAFSIRIVTWAEAAEDLCDIRRRVFVEEQRLRQELEWDGMDADAIHLLARAERDGRPIGAARLLETGQVGRMAVLQPWRGRGVGRALLSEALRIAGSHGLGTPWVNAQTAVLPFYAALGFSPDGEGFDAAGIAHQRMRLTDPHRHLLEDLGQRRLGDHAGLLRTGQPRLIRAAVDALVAQAVLGLSILTQDLEPRLYDREPVLEAVRRLAVQRRGQLTVRVLLVDAQPVIRRGHRLLELARGLSSAVQIRAVPEAFMARSDSFLVVDDQGHCLRRSADPDNALIDFAGPARARRLLRDFERIWEQGEIHQGLRRLFL